MKVGGFVAGVGAGVVLTMAVQAGWSEAGAAAPNGSKIVLENDRVRVRDVTFMPANPNPGMHTHELPHVGIVIDGGTLIFRSPDGTEEKMDLPRGGVGWRGPNVTHEPVNPGRTPVRVIEVEIK